MTEPVNELADLERESDDGSIFLTYGTANAPQVLFSIKNKRVIIHHKKLAVGKAAVPFENVKKVTLESYKNSDVGFLCVEFKKPRLLFFRNRLIFGAIDNNTWRELEESYSDLLHFENRFEDHDT